MSSPDELLQIAKSSADKKKQLDALKKLVKHGEYLASNAKYLEAAKLYEEIAKVYRDAYMAEECLRSYDNATLMLIRVEGTSEIHKEIVRINLDAAQIAEEATEYKRASDFLFRASDFANDAQKQDITMRAADALENLADIKEEQEDYDSAVGLLKKVGRLYITAGDEELGYRIYERATRMALKWARLAKAEGNLVTSGNALAEAAQIMQTTGDAPEATRLMVEAGDLYEAAGMYEKAGNIYDAAHEAYKLQRVTSATRKVMMKAAEAYMKLDGTPEVVGPLAVKAGDMFKEIGRVMKAKWAYKRGSELFADLATKAAEEGDVESEKKYLRFQAMCLGNWGNKKESDEIYDAVVQYYLDRAKEEAGNNDKEAQAISLEEASEVLSEAGKANESKEQLQIAIELYVELAESNSQPEQMEVASKFYSKAAECSKRKGGDDTYREYHRTSSEKAIKAAKYYAQLGVTELATIWTRTAGLEALATEQDELIDVAISLLRKSTKGFIEIKEFNDAFEDMFRVFTIIFEHRPENTKAISQLVKQLDKISKKTQDESMSCVVSILRSMEKGNFIAALLTLQEREEDIAAKHDVLHRLISDKIPKSGIKVSTRYGIR